MYPMTQPDFEEFLTDNINRTMSTQYITMNYRRRVNKTTSIDDSHMLEVNSDTIIATTITNRQHEAKSAE